jgi:acetyl-CoA synthetase
MITNDLKDTYFTEFPGKYFTGDGALRRSYFTSTTGEENDVVIRPDII